MMRIVRSLASFIVAIATLAWPGERSAAANEAWPTQPVRVVVPTTPGGMHDFVSRALGAYLGKELSQPFLTDNRSGGNQTIAPEHVAKARPDGYTLLWGTPATHVFNVLFYNKLSHDPVRDLVPVTFVSQVPLVMVVHPGLGARNLKDLIALYKASPGKLNYGSGGHTTVTHLGPELFKKYAAVDVVHVPYRGMSPVLADLLKGDVTMMMDAMTNHLHHAKAGNVVPIAVPMAKRSSFMPDVPSFAENGLPEVEIIAWNGLFAPRGTPAPIIEKLNAAVNKALADPEIAAKLNELGVHPLAGLTPQSMTAFIAREIETWRPIVAASGVKID